jgi:DHA2 family multidrug resistance protein
MMRNLGGSFGVSISTTLLDQNTQMHHAILAQHVTPYSGYDTTSSLTAIAAQVQSQASILSYLDVFALLGILALVVAPLCFFLPRLPKGVRSNAH